MLEQIEKKEILVTYHSHLILKLIMQLGETKVNKGNHGSLDYY